MFHGTFHCSHDLLTAQHPAPWPQPLGPSAGAQPQGDPGGRSARPPNLEQRHVYETVKLWFIDGESMVNICY